MSHSMAKARKAVRDAQARAQKERAQRTFTHGGMWRSCSAGLGGAGRAFQNHVVLVGG